MKNLIVGECLHLKNSFICSEGEYQNCPCPYRNDISKCCCSISITEKMAEQWNKEGCVSLSFLELKYNPLKIKRR